MRRKIKNITLTGSQETYVRANYNRMTTYEMATNLSISQSKVCVNMELMGLVAARKKAPAIKPDSIMQGCFNIHERGNWII